MLKLKVLAGPLSAALIMAFADLDPGNPMATRMAAITVWMAIWWLTEAVHLAVTAFIPFVFIPLFGIADPKTVAFQYMDQVIFLFIGGFILSFAIEKWGLHERIAIRIMMATGTQADRILMGVMITSFIISMWISNTATTMMLLSAVFAIINMTDKQRSDGSPNDGLAKALLIGLAYAATIGGMATLVGTPPNMVFAKAYQEAYPETGGISFFKWFSFGFPIALMLLAVCFLVLKFSFLKNLSAGDVVDKSYFSDAYQRLGPVSGEQKWVGGVFAFTAFMWFTRADLDLGLIVVPGWSGLFQFPDFIQDSMVAVFMAMLLFLIPAPSQRNTFLLTWKDVSRLPFDIILLFGSGFALAKGFEVSGLSQWLAQGLSMFSNANTLLLILGICIIVCVISEFASNVASIQLVIPILVAFQKDLGVDPLVLLIPATLAASLGFMMPVATAPNTIVFGSNRLSVSDMVRSGWWLNLVGVLIITMMVWLFLTKH
ncbi:MAG: SLC13 family permease [Bacteroidia bacterium]